MADLRTLLCESPRTTLGGSYVESDQLRYPINRRELCHETTLLNCS